MSDLIDRQAVLGELKDLYIENPSCANQDYGWDAAIDTITDKVKDLPSAQQERKIGEWIKVDPHIVICPFCKVASAPKNFCANCGADMRGEQDVKVR